MIRTRRLPAADEAYSPTPEGIHQDNTEVMQMVWMIVTVYQVSSVTLVGRRGVARGGESRLWSLATPTGNYKEAELAGRQDGLLLNHVLTQPYETLYFNDRKGNLYHIVISLFVCLRMKAAFEEKCCNVPRRDILAPSEARGPGV